MKQEQASPELNQFFSNLNDLKKYIKNTIDLYQVNKNDPSIKDLIDIYNMLDKIFKTQGEIDNE